MSFEPFKSENSGKWSKFGLIDILCLSRVFTLDAIWLLQTIPHSTRWSLAEGNFMHRNIGYIGLFRSCWPLKVSGNDKNIAKKQFSKENEENWRMWKKNVLWNHETNLFPKFQKVWLTKSGRTGGVDLLVDWFQSVLLYTKPLFKKTFI